MDQKFRSQISNLLHYHSANAPFCFREKHYIENQKQKQARKLQIQTKKTVQMDGYKSGLSIFCFIWHFTTNDCKC